ncbi:hypothetical protein [Desulfocurvibacter africanus]|uniref:hypothetical protein n=1 Tax=Desulfocurvibacter africanus TaxID=873 RepID=UPI0004891A28|nr:hypothetical protein [Desulfocurvibacter africanus]
MGALKTPRPRAKSERETKSSGGKASPKGPKKSKTRKPKADGWRTLGLTAIGMVLLGAFSAMLLAFFAFPLSGPDEPASPATRTRSARPTVSVAPSPRPEPAPDPEPTARAEPSPEREQIAAPEPSESAQPVWVGQSSSDAMPVELFVPPDGFGGTPWGRPLASLSGMELQPSVGPFEQRRPTGETSFEGEPLQDVLLTLYDDKLAGVSLWLGSQEAYDRVVTRLVGRYGPPRPGEALTWDWPDVGMAAVFMPTQARGVVSISYKPLARQAAEEQEAPPE